MMKTKNSLMWSILTLTFIVFSSISKANNVDELLDICLSTSNMGQEICECVANKADTELTPAGLDFIVASMKKKKAKAKEIAATLELPEMTASGMFMFKAPANCAKELSAN